MSATAERQTVDGQALGGRKSSSMLAERGGYGSHSSDAMRKGPGQLLKGAHDNDGKLKDAALLVGIKLDLEAEIHLSARVNGDITIGLY